MLVGVDGCPNAWIAITQTDDGALDSHHVSDLEAFLDQRQPRIVSIDIPSDSWNPVPEPATWKPENFWASAKPPSFPRQSFLQYQPRQGSRHQVPATQQQVTSTC